MQQLFKLAGIGAASLLLILLSGISPGNAQDQPPILPLRVLTLQFNAAPAEPPSVEPAQDTFVFKVDPVGTVSGDLEGTFTQRITQVDPKIIEPLTSVNQVLDITTFFAIETSEGNIEGYYAGTFYFPEDIYPDALVHQHGQILSVTAAYADLYLAEVFYNGVVDFEEIDGSVIPLGDSGTLVLAPR